MTRRWYPHNLLRWAIGFSVVLIALSLWGWYALGADIRNQFTAFQIATLIFFELVMIGLMMAMGLSTVTADDQGLTVRNLVRTTRLRWDEIAEIRFRHGDPWAYAVLNDDPIDPTRRMLLGVQATDGAACDQAVAELRELLAASRA